MQLDIPDGAQLHIVIGKPPLLALPDETAAPRAAARTGHYLLKGVAALALLCGGFEAGRHVADRPGAGGPLQAALAQPRPAPTAATGQHAFPERPLLRDATGQAAAQVPAAFAAQLRQPPVVIPPPGQPATGGAPGRNAFGLEN